jgi:hypothetical protein
MELGTWNQRRRTEEQVHTFEHPDQTLKQLLTSRLTRSLLMRSWLTRVPTLNAPRCTVCLFVVAIATTQTLFNLVLVLILIDFCC